MKSKKKYVELFKSLVLAFLCVSTVVLLAMTDLFQVHVSSKWNWNENSWGTREEAVVKKPDDGWGQGGVMYPARIGLISEMGCSMLQYDHLVVEDIFSQLINVLTDVLSGASEPTPVSEDLWQKVLSGGQAGVYFDFLGNIPLDNLYMWSSGATNTDGLVKDVVRHLVLSMVDESVVLYYINEQDGLYYACESTADIESRLVHLIHDMEPNCHFGFQLEDRFGSVSAYSVIGSESPKPMVYDVKNPLVIDSDGDYSSEALTLAELYERVSFQLHSATEYSVSDGRTMREGGDSLTVTNRGYVEFRAGESSSPRISITTTGSSATVLEQLDGAWAFVDGVLSPYIGDARLYLMDFEVSDSTTTVYIGYQLDGAYVQVGDLGYCAKVMVTDSRVTEFEFQLRQYIATGQTSLVLDEYRAMVAMEAMGEVGKELMLAYVDRGGDTVSAGWIGK